MQMRCNGVTSLLSLTLSEIRRGFLATQSRPIYMCTDVRTHTRIIILRYTNYTANHQDVPNDAVVMGDFNFCSYRNYSGFGPSVSQ